MRIELSRGSVTTKYNRRLYFERSALHSRSSAPPPPGKSVLLLNFSSLLRLPSPLPFELSRLRGKTARASFCRHSRFPCNPRSFAIHLLSRLLLHPSPPFAPPRLASPHLLATLLGHNESPGLCVAVELNLKGPPYPKRAHSRRCIHLVGRKGDQKLNSYLEVFATSLSSSNVCVCVYVCVHSAICTYLRTCVRARSTPAFDSS